MVGATSSDGFLVLVRFKSGNRNNCHLPIATASSALPLRVEAARVTAAVMADSVTSAELTECDN